MRLIVGILRHLPLFLQRAQFAAQRVGCRLVDEIFQGIALLDLGQVGDNGAAQADQETGKDKGNDPQPEAEPFFRQA